MLLDTPDPSSSESLTSLFKAQSFDLNKGKNSESYLGGYFCLEQPCDYSIYKQQMPAYKCFLNLQKHYDNKHPAESVVTESENNWCYVACNELEDHTITDADGQQNSIVDINSKLQAFKERGDFDQMLARDCDVDDEAENYDVVCTLQTYSATQELITTLQLGDSPVKQRPNTAGIQVSSRKEGVWRRLEFLRSVELIYCEWGAPLSSRRCLWREESVESVGMSGDRWQSACSERRAWK